MYNPTNPVIVQGDRTLLLEVHHPAYEDVRDALGRFADLEKSPEHIHTYRISPLSLWNAAASGLTSHSVQDCLVTYSKYDIPQSVLADITTHMERYGIVRLIKEEDQLILTSHDSYVILELANRKEIRPYISNQLDTLRLLVQPGMRGHIKHALVRIGFPVEDLAGYVVGDYLAIHLSALTSNGQPLQLRDYQKQAVDVFYAGGANHGGSGVIVLPCGAGKTITGIAAMTQIQSETLILTTNTTALRQWKQELLDKTDLSEDCIGEYSGERKEIKPVTITTYQMLTHRQGASQEFPHIDLFTKQNWGFIIYDEVHLLPAPVFRITAEIQAKRRLGLTATLIREDGLENDVFSLIGPKKYDVPWKALEKQGWIAEAHCVEIRIPMPELIKMDYAMAPLRDKFRIAAENPDKVTIIHQLLAKHQGHHVLIIGQYVNQLQEIATVLNVPIITGKTNNSERIRLYDQFKKGELPTLVVSKVANFAIDLPDANVAIQISGTFGSRQEEAQRLGRILRPKPDTNESYFYSIVTANSREQDFATKRQLFLTEQGYKYKIITTQELEV